MKLTIGFSPCPNDTFIFDALVNHKIDTGDIEFEVFLEDVQTLNEWATNGKLMLSKVSYGVLPLLIDQYKVLNSGGALGKGVGPLLITKPGSQNNPSLSVNEMSIAVPGINTTANLLFSYAYPKATNKIFKVFNEIEDAVLNGEVDAGVIIHENRFTYLQRGLTKIIDLGTYWEEQIKTPIPLGGIVIKKNMDTQLQLTIDGLIRKSLEYAFSHYPQLTDYVKLHAQEMSEDVMRQHINLYVNDYSLALGEDGKKAVTTFLDVYSKMHHTPLQSTQTIFLEA